MDELKPDESREIGEPNAARALLIVGFVGMGVFALAYRLMVMGSLEQSAAMFVGLPTLLATLTVLFARPRTAIGMALTATTLALLASAILFQEGFVCILFAMPLFYGIAIGAAVLYDYIRGRKGGPRAFGWAVLPLVIASTEGVWIDLPREASVTASRVVSASPEQVRLALSAPPDLTEPMSALLKIGFPLPQRAEGSGLAVDDRRVILFGGGEGKPGEMELRVSRAEPDRLTFDLVRDESHLSHWLDWDRSEIRLVEVEGGTRVDWTVHYTRQLDPAWYFDPLQRVVVHGAADWLILSTATPR